MHFSTQNYSQTARLKHKLTLPLVLAMLVTVTPTSVVFADDALPEDAIATVNGKPILRYARDVVIRQLQGRGQEIDEARIVEELINLELLAQVAEERELQKDSEVSALLRLQYTQTMAQTLMGKLSEDIDVTDDMLRAEYDKQTAGMQIDEYRASHILLEDEQSAKTVIESLASGKDFAELAKSESTGPTGPNGGDLGWFQAASMVPAFSDALVAMEIGDTSAAPVKSEFGWHVIKLVDKRGANKPKFEDTKNELRNLILRNKLNEQIEKMRASATIVTK